VCPGPLEETPSCRLILLPPAFKEQPVNDTVRLSVEIPKEINDQLGTFIQWGLKADVIKALIDLLIKAHDRDQYVVLRLLNGKCILTDAVHGPTDVQNLSI